MITEQIQSVLDKMHEILHNAVGPRNRREYMIENGISDEYWHFSLTADDIIKNKIPANVMGCTGRAKLFCKLAAENGIDCFVVCCAKLTDWYASREYRIESNHRKIKTMSGHQVIMVEIDGKLKMFDPGLKQLNFLDCIPDVGNIVKFPGESQQYLITAVMKPSDFAKMDSAKKFCHVYASGDMNNPEFTIVPRKNKVFFQNIMERR